MKTKTGIQIVQAVLVMLAMICGMLLLPGNEVRSSTECEAPQETETDFLEKWLRPLLPGDCESRSVQ